MMILPGHILNVEEDDIFHEFPPGTLTDEVWTKQYHPVLEHMEQSHTEATAAIQSAKEASPHDAIGSFQTSSTIDDPPHHHNKRTTRSMHRTWCSQALILCMGLLSPHIGESSLSIWKESRHKKQM